MQPRKEIRTPEELGDFIRQVRENRGMTQRQFARELGLSQHLLREMEAGKPGMLTDRLFNILCTTGIHLSGQIPNSPDRDSSNTGPFPTD